MTGHKESANLTAKSYRSPRGYALVRAGKVSSRTHTHTRSITMSVMDSVNTLKPLVSQLKQSDRDFATSLIQTWEKKGRLSQMQQVWVDKLIARANEPKPEQVRVDLHTDMRPLYGLFQRARDNKIQMPKIKTHLESGTNFTLSLNQTGEFIYLKLGDVYYGKVDRDGKLAIHPRMKPCEEIYKLAADIGENPSKVGKIHGAKWDNCMFCGRGLQTKDSVYYGYGPICAEKWGLEWGAARERLEERKEACISEAFQKQVSQFFGKV